MVTKMRNAISYEFLAYYDVVKKSLQLLWISLQGQKQARMVSHFHWWLVHKALFVSLQKLGYDPSCKYCGFLLESQKYCL